MISRVIPIRRLSIFVREQPRLVPQWQRQTSVQDVVVCIGGPESHSSITALKSACELVSRDQRNEASIKAIHVPESRNWRDDPKVRQILQSVEQVNASTSPDVGVDIIPGGSVRKAIVENIKSKQPDLVVIGGSSRGVAQRVFGTLQYVVKNSPCDVLVVRDESLMNGEPIKTLVCFGINDWEGSLDAFKAALRIARPGDSIEAVHVVYTDVNAIHGPAMVAPKGSGTIASKIAQALEKAMLESLDDHSTVLSRTDVDIKPVVLHAGIDSPVKVLVNYAGDNNVNLLSVGVGSIGRVFNQVNFSYSLTHHSPCSVLVARKTVVSSSVPNFYVEDPTEWVNHKSFI
jgi:nucleotide-binding universal stress UspA family protein